MKKINEGNPLKKVETGKPMDVEIEDNTEIKAKNINIRGRILKLSCMTLVAATLGATYIASKLNKESVAPEESEKTIITEQKAESKKSYSRPKFDNVIFPITEKPEITSLSLQDYENGVVAAYNEISKYTSDNNLIRYIAAAFYIVNSDYIDGNLERKLIEEGYILGAPDEDETLELNAEMAFCLFDGINKYNHDKIKKSWYAGDTDLSNILLNPSVLCADKNDSEVISNVFSSLVNTYDLNQDSIRNNSTFHQASMLIADSSISSGAKYLAEYIESHETRSFISDYLHENYTTAEVAEAYDNLYSLRKNIELLDESTELSYLMKQIYSYKKYRYTGLTPRETISIKIKLLS